MRGVLLLSLLVQLAVAGAPTHNKYAQNDTKAFFLRGALRTNSDDRRRYLTSVDDVSTHSKLWLLQLDAKQQESVGAWLEQQGASVLHPVPPYHWLVKASASNIVGLLKAHSGTSAVPYPAEFKQARVLDALLPVSARYATAAAVAQLRASNEGTSGAGNRKARLGTTAPEAPTTFRQQLPSSVQHIPLLNDGAQDTKLGLLILGSQRAQGADHAARMAAATAWARHLQQGLEGALDTAPEGPCGPKMTTLGVSPQAMLEVCVSDLQPAVSWLTQQPEVLWVDVTQSRRASDLLANAISQTGGLPSVDQVAAAGGDVRRAVGALPLWAAGLDGRNQTVGVVDTGLDTDSCFFWDPQYPILEPTGYVKGRTQQWEVFESEDHRKVSMYVMMQDGTDNNEGHGTHVAGLVAGLASGTDATSDPDLATGIAPGAKIAFVDLGNNYQSNDVVHPPEDPYDLFEVMYKKGVRIASNSWTHDPPDMESFDYTPSHCDPLDAYLWERQDMLVVFSSGNAGRLTDMENTTGTILAPANCKNVFAVGATDNLVVSKTVTASRDDAGNAKDVQLSQLSHPSDIRGLLFQGRDKTTGAVVHTLFLPMGSQVTYWDGPTASFTSLLGGTWVVAQADIHRACFELLGDFSAKVVLFPRGGCSFFIKGDNVVSSKAAAGVVYNNRHGTENDGLGWDEPLVTPLAEALVHAPTPLAAITLASGTTLVGWFAEGLGVTMEVVGDEESLPAHESVAAFSSFGASPSPDPDLRQGQDLRIKPDLVAPGRTHSAASDGEASGMQDTCATSSRIGTSMATPLVSGGAALVRQYFMDGFYPSGAPSRGAGFEPSAALLKAVLLAGAAPLEGFFHGSGRRLQPPPDPHQGWGRLDLGRSLPLVGETASSSSTGAGGWGLQVVDRAVMREVGEEHVYEVQVGGDEPLIVMLAYVDYPNTPGMVPACVNNLNLVVSGPDRGRLPQGQTSWYGNDAPDGDSLNAVERVYVTEPAAGTYTVTVTAAYLYLHARPQQYALVFLGGVSGTVESPYNPASGPPAPRPPPPPHTPPEPPFAPMDPPAPGFPGIPHEPPPSPQAFPPPASSPPPPKNMESTPPPQPFPQAASPPLGSTPPSPPPSPRLIRRFPNATTPRPYQTRRLRRRA